MANDTLKNNGDESILQFSVFAANKVGRLNDVFMLLAKHDVHLIALCALDNTDSGIIRMIVDYPEQAREVLVNNNFAFTETEVTAVEMDSEADIVKVTSTLLQAEINIHYAYPFIMRPGGKCGLAMHLEDHDLGMSILNQSGIKALSRSDIAR